MTYIHDLKSSSSILKAYNTKNKNRILSWSNSKHTFAVSSFGSYNTVVEKFNTELSFLL